jgi:hypothetical protein
LAPGILFFRTNANASFSPPLPATPLFALPLALKRHRKRGTVRTAFV